MSQKKKEFEPKPVKKVLHDILGQKQLKRGIESVRICNAWGDVMGKNIASYTDEVRYSKNTLYVRLRSAALKVELSYSLRELAKRMNTHLEGEFIEKIILI